MSTSRNFPFASHTVCTLRAYLPFGLVFVCLFFFFVTVIIYLERLRTITLGTRGFFSRVTRSFVGRRRTRLRPTAEETSGEAARKNLWRRAP